MATTTKTQITDGQRDYFNRTLLMRASPHLTFDKFGQLRPIPLNISTLVRFRRYDALAVNTTALTEGTTPAEKQLAVTDVTAVLSQYGDFVVLSDLVMGTSIEQAMTEGVEVVGHQAGRSVDLIYRNILDAGSNVFYSNGASRSAVNSVIDVDDLDRVIRSLEENDAMMVTKIIAAGGGVDTSPISPGYIAVVHPHVLFTLRNLGSEWIPVYKYANQMKTIAGEVGAYKQIRFVMTTQSRIRTGAGAAGSGIKTTSGAADVYETLVFGQEAYGICPLKGRGLESIQKGIGSSGVADALNQRASAGWKATVTAAILNDNFLARLESASAS